MVTNNQYGQDAGDWTNPEKCYFSCPMVSSFNFIRVVCHHARNIKLSAQRNETERKQFQDSFETVSKQWFVSAKTKRAGVFGFA